VPDPALTVLVLFLYCWPSAATYLIDVAPLFQPLWQCSNFATHVGAEAAPVSTPGQLFSAHITSPAKRRKLRQDQSRETTKRADTYAAGLRESL
jgi:hypothetical protein